MKTQEEKNTYQREWAKKNRHKTRVYDSNWAIKNPDKVRMHRRDQHLKKTYGISLIEFGEMFRSQGYKCMICGGTEPEGKNWHMDHKGNVNRGILCGSCNQGLGNFKDDLNRLRSAIEYLEQQDPTR